MNRNTSFDEFVKKFFHTIQNLRYLRNVLNEIEEVKKETELFQGLHTLLEKCRKLYLEKIPAKDKKISKCIKKISFFEKYN